MTRQQAEDKILELLKEIEKVHKEYNPNGRYLTMRITPERIGVNNEDWFDEGKFMINAILLKGADDE